MKARLDLPSPSVLSVASAFMAVIFILLAVLLLKIGHSDVATTVPATTDATVGARGILSALLAFVFGLCAVGCVVFFIVFLRKRDEQ
jgi:hypothetical protein